MGRHSSPDKGHFYRSFLGWLGLWLMIAVVTAVGVWLVVSAIGGPDAAKSIAAEAALQPEDEPEERETPAPTVSAARITNAETPDVVVTPSSLPERKDKNKGATTKLDTEGVTVQVLNGTSQPAAAQALADKLSGLGYTIVAVEESSRLYPKTTVFWSIESSREAAMALADRFGWVAEPKPANLSTGVSLHVVVGADET